MRLVVWQAGGSAWLRGTFSPGAVARWWRWCRLRSDESNQCGQAEQDLVEEGHGVWQQQIEHEQGLVRARAGAGSAGGRRGCTRALGGEEGTDGLQTAARPDRFRAGRTGDAALALVSAASDAGSRRAAPPPF